MTNAAVRAFPALRVFIGCALAASLLPAQSLFVTSDGLEQARQLAHERPWAKSVIDQTLATAKAWPQSHLAKYGLSELALPTEGGQWTLWYVCPVHGVSLKYTPPQKHTCPIDGKLWTGWPYDQVTFDRRHDDLANAARDLALAFRWTGERAYGEQSAWILNQYARLYSTYALHDKDNKTARTGARVHAQTLDESVWLLPIAWAYDLLKDSDLFDDTARASIETDLLRAAAATILRYDAGKSNWQSWHNAALAAAGYAAGDAALVDGAIDGKSGFRYQMRNSITPDGFWFEGAWGYHFYALDPLLRLARMAQLHGTDLWSEPPLRRMFEAPLKLTLPNGNLPAFNDSREVSLYGYDTLYEYAYSAYSEDQFALVLGRRARGLNALLFGAPDLPSVEPAPLTSAAFPESGYAVLRAPESDLTLITKFGPHGGGHGHYDKLTFVTFANGFTQAIDPGTQSYAAPTHTTWDKVTIAHNTITADGLTQSESTGSLLWADLENPEYRAVRIDAGPDAYPFARLTRTLLVTKEYIVDQFVTASLDGKSHTWDWAYHQDGAVTTDLETAPLEGLSTSNGYQNLTALRSAEADAGWQASFDPSPVNPVTYGTIYNSSSNAKGTLQQVRGPAFAGRFALKASYEFAASSYILYTSPLRAATLPGKVSVMVYGDGSGHQIGIRLMDAGGEKYVKTLGIVDWVGWKKLEAEAPEKWSHYQGDANNQFDLPVTAFVVEFTYKQGGAASGAIYLDDVQFDDQTVLDFEPAPRQARVRMLGSPGSRLITAEGLGPDLTHPISAILDRRNSQVSEYISLFEPFLETPKIAVFEKLEDGRLHVRTAQYEDFFLLTNEGVAGFERRWLNP